jgi:hypothetical protein
VSAAGSLDLAQLEMRYHPYPIGIAAPCLEAAHYAALVDSFPQADLFEEHRDLGKPGAKLTLSEKSNPDRYHAFLRDTPVWRDFHAQIKEAGFPYRVLDELRRHRVDLPYERVSGTYRAFKVLRQRSFDYLVRNPRLRTRFEFSILRGDGGHLPPHTDHPSKVATLIVSMARPGEWNLAHGGGTDILAPLDPTRAFNETNETAGFEEMKVLHTYAFEPNQVICFVKTYDSWHAVAPIRAGDPNVLRRTLTINIEKF